MFAFLGLGGDSLILSPRFDLLYNLYVLKPSFWLSMPYLVASELANRIMVRDRQYFHEVLYKSMIETIGFGTKHQTSCRPLWINHDIVTQRVRISSSYANNRLKVRWDPKLFRPIYCSGNFWKVFCHITQVFGMNLLPYSSSHDIKSPSGFR